MFLRSIGKTQGKPLLLLVWIHTRVQSIRTIAFGGKPGVASCYVGEKLDLKYWSHPHTTQVSSLLSYLKYAYVLHGGFMSDLGFLILLGDGSDMDCPIRQISNSG